LYVLPCDKKTAKVTNFIELAILEFGCPGMTHFTNFTRMPLMLLLFANANKSCYALLPVVVSLSPSAVQLPNPQFNHDDYDLS